uniref:Uncharacterized protein n=1 Tax=Nelumbo nucifera TaxID=4432 RepID=A0A822Z9Q2_NELNU|nr:TPA_asm: hypothetical protein HUJ06_015616 [Nelumbo nucifera]
MEVLSLPERSADINIYFSCHYVDPKRTGLNFRWFSKIGYGKAFCAVKTLLFLSPFYIFFPEKR